MRRFSPARLTTAPWPAKMPLVGKTTAEVKPALRASSMRRSVALKMSAARTQLVVAGRSSGPRAGGGVAVCAGVEGTEGVREIILVRELGAEAAAASGASAGMSAS